MAEDNEFSAARKGLWNEIVAIHDVWEQYVYLFNESPERIRLLNACAGWFFATSQRVMMRETILGICRLTDAPGGGRFKNLVLATLLTDPEVDAHEGLADEMTAEMNVLDSLVKPIRKHRDKYIAHLDHEVAVRTTEELVPGIKKGLINDAITKMGGVYNLHGARTRDSHASFSLHPTGSAKSLVELLETSDRWKEWQEFDREHGKS